MKRQSTGDEGELFLFLFRCRGLWVEMCQMHKIHSTMALQGERQ